MYIATTTILFCLIHRILYSIFASITSHMFVYVTGDGKPCPYGQTGTSLATCGGE